MVKMNKRFKLQLVFALFFMLLATSAHAGGSAFSNISGCSFGRFSCNLRAGVEFSQEKDKFSQANPYVQFVGDTLWKPDLHTYIDVTLASIPTETTETDGQEETFIESKKSVSGTMGGYWKIYSPADMDQYSLFLAIIGKVGMQTLTESLSEEDSTADTANHFESVGFRIGEHESSSTTNKPLKRSLDATWGYYENLKNSKVTVEGLLQSNQNSGLFIGFKAMGGKGEDDIRIFTGINLPFTKLEALVQQLIPAGLQ